MLSTEFASLLRKLQGKSKTDRRNAANKHNTLPVTTPVDDGRGKLFGEKERSKHIEIIVKPFNRS